MTTPLLSLSEVSEGVVNQAAIHNTALRQLEALLVRALSMDATAPPGSPAAGDSYIIPTGATGAWSGKDDQIAAFIGGAWSYFTATEGLRLWINDLDTVFAFDGATWGEYGGGGGGDIAAAIAAHEAEADPHPDYLTQTEGDARYLQSVGAQPFDVHSFYPGIPSASAKVLRVPIARAVTFPANFAGSYFTASVNATSTTVFDVQKNGSSIGSISIAAGSTIATFTTTSGTAKTFAAGDILSIIGPVSPDATLADAGLALAGTR